MTEYPGSSLPESMKMGNITTSQSSTMTARLVKSIFNPTVHGEEGTSIPQPGRMIVQPTKRLSRSMVLHVTAQSSTLVWPSVKTTLELMLLKIGEQNPQPSGQEAKQDFGLRVWIHKSATFETPIHDQFSHWRLAMAIHPYCVLDLKLCGSQTRSRSQRLALAPTFPIVDVSTEAGCGETSSSHYLVSTSPTKRNTKLQAVQAKIAKQVQEQKQAVSRANKAAQLLRDTRIHDAKYRRQLNAKKQAEKAVRVYTENLYAIRKEEMDLLLKLEKKRRRNCERWDHAQDLSEGGD